MAVGRGGAVDGWVSDMRPMPMGPMGLPAMVGDILVVWEDEVGGSKGLDCTIFAGENMKDSWSRDFKKKLLLLVFLHYACRFYSDIGNKVQSPL